MSCVKYTLSEIAGILNGKLKGDPNYSITSVGSVNNAARGEITFLIKDLTYPSYLTFLLVEKSGITQVTNHGMTDEVLNT